MLAERERAEFYEWKGEEGCGSFEGSGGEEGGVGLLRADEFDL